MEEQNMLQPLSGTSIRKVWHNEQWYFSIVDIIEVLADTDAPSQYWAKVKKRDTELLPIWLKLKLLAPDGKMRPTDCANTEGVLRIVMSVPSPKAEPLKLWLAQVGKERIEETENPELLTARQAELYRAKGYPEDWIAQRVQTIETRKELTDEWKKRGVKEGQEYSILTAEIAKATFGVTPSEHKTLKALERQNLRDHMTRLELIFTALGEELSRDQSVRLDAQGFEENREAAVKGGNIAAVARQNVERLRGEQVVSSSNFLGLVNGEKTIEALPEPEKPV
jgi:prophage antirepressor-like protein